MIVTPALRKPCPREPQPCRQVAWSLIMPNVKMGKGRAFESRHVSFLSACPPARATRSVGGQRQEASALLALVGRVSLGAEVRRRRALREVTAKDGRDERSEDDIGAAATVLVLARILTSRCYEPEGWEREPQEEDKFERVVEGEPVDDADEALDEANNLSATNPALGPKRLSPWTRR
jgi:hypothetical protein